MLMCLKSFFEYSCFISRIFSFLDKYSVVWTLVTKRDNKMVFLMTQKVETNGRRVIIFFFHLFSSTMTITIFVTE